MGGQNTSVTEQGIGGNTRPLYLFSRSEGVIIHFSTMEASNCHICLEPFTTCRCLEDIATNASSQSTSGSRASADTTSRARHWCFTLNGPTEEELSNISGISAASPACMYLVYQLERGAQGRPHLQGYIEFNSAQRFNAVKRLISPRIHLEVRRGTRQQARDYCMKTATRIDGPWEFGTWHEIGQGRRTDLGDIRDKIKSGATEIDLWEDHFNSMARNYRAIDRYRGLVSVPRDSEPMVHILYGPTGTGKSRWAFDTFPGAYWKSQDNWWDEYDKHETVIFDEFYGWIKFSLLLRICDRYPLRMERKGGFVNFKSKTLIFTTNKKPEEWYPNISNFDAFIRRVNIWHYMPEKDTHHTVTNYDTFKRLID